MYMLGEVSQGWAIDTLVDGFEQWPDGTGVGGFAHSLHMLKIRP